MSSSGNILIAIPVYNHRATLCDIATKSAAYGDVLIIDDGSTDNVSEDIAALDVAYIRHKKNMGKGKAILTAANYAAEHNYTHIITIDADGQHLPEDIPTFFDAIRKDPMSVAVGVRNFTDATARNIPISATFGRAFSNFWFRVQTGEKAYDTQSGFRAYPVALLQNISFTDARYSFEIEVIVKAAWAGLNIQWIPVSVYYPEPHKRVSHLHRVYDNIRISWLNTRLTIRAVLPIPHRKLVQTASQKKEPSFRLTRPVESIRNIVKQGATPEHVGSSAALGVLMGTLPLFGVHTISTLFAASFFRQSKVIAVGASQFCMPPLVPAMCIEVGYFLRNGTWLTDVSWQTLGVEFLDRAYEWILGSLILAPILAGIAGILFYGITRSVASLKHSEKKKEQHKPTAKTWSSKSLASRWKHEFFYMLIKVCGRWPAYIFSCIVVLFYVLFVPVVHTRSSFYISKRFPDSSKITRWFHTWRLCQNLAFSLIDKAAVGILGTEEFTYTLKGVEKLKSIQKEGKGLILLTAHVGCWQSSMGGLKTLETPVHLMMLRDSGDVDSQYFEFQQHENINVIHVEDTMRSVLEVTAALKRNEIVSIMGDRIFPPTAYTDYATFLGEKALFPTAAYKISQATGTPIALLLTRKVGASHMELTVSTIFTVPKDAGKNYSPFAQSVAHTLEQYTQKTPYQFYNFFDLWSTDHE